ncbi:MAG: AAA family ATPase, partial [Ignisphaera sp.]
MLIGVFGDLGSGKTLFLVYLAQKSNCEVYANFTIKLPNVKVLTPELFFKILKENPEPNRPKLLLLDELYTLADSRASVSLRNRLLSYLIFQSRKRNMDIVYTAQLYGSIDLRLRDLTH